MYKLEYVIIIAAIIAATVGISAVFESSLKDSHKDLSQRHSDEISKFMVSDSSAVPPSGNQEPKSVPVSPVDQAFADLKSGTDSTVSLVSLNAAEAADLFAKIEACGDCNKPDLLSAALVLLPSDLSLDSLVALGVDKSKLLAQLTLESLGVLKEKNPGLAAELAHESLLAIDTTTTNVDALIGLIDEESYSVDKAKALLVAAINCTDCANTELISFALTQANITNIAGLKDALGNDYDLEQLIDLAPSLKAAHSALVSELADAELLKFISGKSNVTFDELRSLGVKGASNFDNQETPLQRVYSDLEACNSSNCNAEMDMFLNVLSITEISAKSLSGLSNSVDAKKENVKTTIFRKVYKYSSEILDPYLEGTATDELFKFLDNKSNYALENIINVGADVDKSHRLHNISSAMPPIYLLARQIDECKRSSNGCELLSSETASGAVKRYREAFEKILEVSSIESINAQEPGNRRNVLNRLAYVADYESIEKVLEREGVDVDSLDHYNRSAVYLASWQLHVCYYPNSVYCYSGKDKAKQAFEHLLAMSNKDAILAKRESSENTILYYFGLIGDGDLVELVLDKLGADANSASVANQYNEYPVYAAAYRVYRCYTSEADSCFTGKEQTRKAFEKILEVSSIESINAPESNNGYNVLNRLAYVADYDLIQKVLARKGVNVDSLDDYNRSAVYLASWQLHACYYPDQRYCYSGKDKAKQAFEHLLAMSNKDAILAKRESSENTILYYFGLIGDGDLVELVLARLGELGADANSASVANQYNEYPVYAAAYRVYRCYTSDSCFTSEAQAIKAFNKLRSISKSEDIVAKVKRDGDKSTVSWLSLAKSHPDVQDLIDESLNAFHNKGYTNAFNSFLAHATKVDYSGQGLDDTTAIDILRSLPASVTSIDFSNNNIYGNSDFRDDLIRFINSAHAPVTVNLENNTLYFGNLRSIIDHLKGSNKLKHLNVAGNVFMVKYGVDLRYNFSERRHYYVYSYYSGSHKRETYSKYSSARLCRSSTSSGFTPSMAYILGISSNPYSTPSYEGDAYKNFPWSKIQFCDKSYGVSSIGWKTGDSYVRDNFEKGIPN